MNNVTGELESQEENDELYETLRSAAIEDAASGIQSLKIVAHNDALNAGWYTDLATGEPKKLNVGERIALMHSELSEAFEAWRKDLNDDHLPHRKGIEVELADCVIRIMDFCGADGYDIEGAIIEKLHYNRNVRKDHSIEARKGVNGKKC